MTALPIIKHQQQHHQIYKPRADRAYLHQIRSHGMFYIKSGTSYVVQNWIYVDIIVYVTVLARFM